MDLPSETQTIGSHAYTISRMPYGPWRTFFGRVRHLIGQPLAALLASGGEFDESNPAIGNAIVAALDACDDVTLEFVSSHLGKYATVKGPDTVPAGQGLDLQAQEFWWPSHLEDLLPWLALGIKVQLAPFFSGAGAILDAAKIAR